MASESALRRGTIPAIVGIICIIGAWEHNHRKNYLGYLEKLRESPLLTCQVPENGETSVYEYGRAEGVPVSEDRPERYAFWKVMEEANTTDGVCDIFEPAGSEWLKAGTDIRVPDLNGDGEVFPLPHSYGLPPKL